ncbi:unnamed protein product, partial [Iphiclides podalirius]
MELHVKSSDCQGDVWCLRYLLDYNVKMTSAPSDSESNLYPTKAVIMCLDASFLPGCAIQRRFNLPLDLLNRKLAKNQGKRRADIDVNRTIKYF